MKGIKSYFQAAPGREENKDGNSRKEGENTDIQTNAESRSDRNNVLKSTVEASHVVSDKPNHPSSSFVFKKTLFGKHNRSFQHAWLLEFEWLDFNEHDDSVTCFVCKKHLPKLNLERKEEAFITTGFRYWKNALNKFKQHAQSKCHIAAVTFEVTIPQCGDILEMTSEKIKSNMEDNRKCLLKIIETIQFLGRQGLALRGDTSDENSNFMQLLKLRCKDFPKLSGWLKKKKEKYTSHDIQNELLMLMAHQILRDLANEIKDSYYATICDEYTDISNKEQLTFCLRWVDDLFDIHEDFLGFYEVQNIKSETIVSAITDILLRIQISLDNCRGQCYDGASNMLGKKSGVAKQIQDKQPKAFVTHCHCHSLSLSVKDTTNESKILSHTMDTTGEIAVLVKYSPKREQKLEAIKVIDEEDESTNRIAKLSTTRWTVRANSFQRIIENYRYLHQLWDDCLSESGLNRDVKSRIIGCQSQMETFDYYFGLKLGKLLYSHTDKLSQTLQKEKMSAVSSKRIAMLTVETIATMRNSDGFDALYDVCLKEIQKIPFINDPVLKRKRKNPKYSMLFYLEGNTSNSDAHHVSIPRDHYRQQFFEAIDVLVAAIRDRFNQPSFLVFESLESLLLKTLEGKEISAELKTVRENYASDIDEDSLMVELESFKVLMKEKKIDHFSELLREMKLLEKPEKKFLSNICKICKILAVNPASSATAERTFSLARRVKNWMRSSMLPMRFNSVSMLHFHKDRTDKLDLIKIANGFVSSDEKRLRIFGKFSEKDL